MVGTVAKQPLAAGCDHFDHPTVRTKGPPKVNAILLFLERVRKMFAEHYLPFKLSKYAISA